MKLIVFEGGYEGVASVSSDQSYTPEPGGPYAIEVPDDVGVRWIALQAEYDVMAEEIRRRIMELPDE